MFRDKKVELWVNAEICVMEPGEQYWDGKIEYATTPANSINDDVIKWEQFSSWDSFDEDTSDRVWRLLKERDIAKKLDGVSVRRLIDATADLKNTDEHTHIGLGDETIILSDGLLVKMDFYLDASVRRD